MMVANIDKTSANDGNGDEDGTEFVDWQLPISFNQEHHTETIEGANAITQTWRMKERMKTVSVALVLCLNVGVDPPDIVKTQPCARLECWLDPLSMSPQKALELIGANLQKQYERWQPRARYKQSLDPTVEEVKKLCTSLCRNAKEERVLFHYNGHGVPKPTSNGEIWVFNRMYTQYIPLSVYDLQTWMGAPSIYVYDCSNAGVIVDLFKQFAEQHEKEYEELVAALQWMVLVFENSFLSVALQELREGSQVVVATDVLSDAVAADVSLSPLSSLKRNASRDRLKTISWLSPGGIYGTATEVDSHHHNERLKRVSSSSSISSLGTTSAPLICWSHLPCNCIESVKREDGKLP